MSLSNFKNFLLGVFFSLSFILLSGQTYYNSYSVNSIMKKLNELDVISSEINEIKAQIKYGFKVNGGHIDEVTLPVKVDGGNIDRVNNSIDCLCYKGK